MELVLFLGTWFFATMLFIGLDMLRVKWIRYWRTHGERPFFEPWDYSEMEDDVNFWEDDNHQCFFSIDFLSILTTVVVIGIIVYIAGWWIRVW